MKVLVDTSIWSAALRRSKGPETASVQELRALILEHRVEMIGPIRQEILSGIRSEGQFSRLEKSLEPFPDLPIDSDDHVAAAKFFNLCRGRGVQGSNTDFLICAVAARHRMEIFSTDNDFLLFAKHIPIKLHKIR